MSRFTLGLSLALIVLGAVIPSRPNSAVPDVTFESILPILKNPPVFDSASAPLVESFEQAVRLDPANPFAWADLADVYSLSGCTPSARSAYAVALGRAGTLLVAQLRAAAFYARCGDPAATRSVLRAVLARHPEFAYPIFDFYREQRLASSDQLETYLPATRPAAEAYVQYLIEKRGLYSGPRYFTTLKSAWRFLTARWPDSATLADSYVRMLVTEKRFDEASRLWRSQAEHPPTSANLLSNPGFESPPHNWLFDWTLSPWPHVEAQRDTEVAHSGSASMRIRFDGLVNTSYSHIAQRVVVSPGPYCLSLWGRSEGITSDQGIGVRFFDPADNNHLNVFVLQFTGTTSWRMIEECFTIPAETAFAELQIIRSASNQPNGRIGGIVWIDDVSLAPTKPK